MMNTSKTILFFGTDNFSAPALTALIDAGYSIAAVVTKPDSRSGRGQHLQSPIVKQIAEAHGIPVWQPASLHDIAADIAALGDVAGVLSSYGMIIPADIIALFSPGIINIHPSLLPLLRGPSPIETAILSGDHVSGISIMKLTQRMDAGPLYVQQEIGLTGTETSAELYESMAAQGAALLIASLDAILDGHAEASAQDESLASYTRLLKKEDSLIDPSSFTATDIERRVRAFITYPKTKMVIGKQLITVLKARAIFESTVAGAGASAGLVITCQNESLLEIEELIGPSGKKMTGQAFKNGYAAG
jgi:methionyl-tRNA formyltransferase